jgi:hypothetical protein
VEIGGVLEMWRWMKERKYGEGRKRSRGKGMREMEKWMKGEGEWGNKGSEERNSK